MRFESLRNKNVFRYIHMALGIIFVGVGYAQCQSGFSIFRESNTLHRDLPAWVKIVSYCLAAGTVLRFCRSSLPLTLPISGAIVLYVIGWAVEARRPTSGGKYSQSHAINTNDMYMGDRFAAPAWKEQDQYARV